MILTSASALFADTVIVTATQALVWNKTSSPSFVLTQLRRDTRLDVVRRVDEWFEIVLPPGRATQRTGFIRVTQVAIISVGPMSAAARQVAGINARLARTRTRRVILSVDLGFRPGGSALTRRATAFAERYAEDGTLTADYGRGSGPQFDLMASQAVWGNLGVGVGLSSYQRRSTTTIAAQVPHPFFFNALRPATFETTAPEGTEVALHIPVVWTPSSGTRLTLLVFGGPSVFHVTQNVVSNLTLSDPYPPVTVTITGVTTTRLTGTMVGFHVGGDLGYYGNKRFGVGAGVRYSFANLTFADDTAATDGRAGGLQIVGGLRVRF